LLSKLEFLLEIFGFGPELIVLFDELDDVGVKTEHALIQFEIIYFVNRARYTFGVFKNAHVAILTSREEEAKVKISRAICV
jgi:hypothetical protein